MFSFTCRRLKPARFIKMHLRRGPEGPHYPVLRWGTAFPVQSPYFFSKFIDAMC